MTLHNPFLLSVSLALACGFAAVSCGGSSNGGGGAGGSGGGSGSGDCTSVDTAICNKLQQCAPIALKVAYGDMSTCIQRLGLACTATTTAPGVTDTPAEFAACANDYAALSCSDMLNNVEPSSCKIKGSRADGEPCGSDEQCQSAFCKTNGSNCGACGEPAAAGDPCTKNADCASGLVCATGVCKTPVDAGGQCTDKSDCASGLTCKSGTCALPGGAGAPCSVTAQDCDTTAGLFCSTNAVCTSVGTASAGQACGVINGTYVVCTGGGYCKGGLQGTCEAPAANGAACSPTGPTCLSPAQCLNSTCELPNPASCG
jgi:hypothetical protein